MTVLFAPAPGAQAASTIVVSLSAGGCGKYNNPGAEQIWAAVAALPPAGGTILVCPGTYDAFDVDGKGKITIKAALPGETNMPVVVPTNGAGGGTIIYIVNSASVTLDGLVINGDNFTNVLTGPATGVRFQNSSGAVQNSIITGLRNYPFGSGTPHQGLGITADYFVPGKTGSITIRNNLLRDIETTPIKVEGKIKATTSGNYILPSTTASGEESQDGISYWSGASGSISKNVIDNAHSGIFLYGTSKVSVSGNTISDSFYGIYLAASCLANNELTNGTKITANTLSGASVGIEMVSSSSGICNPAVSATTVSKNVFGGVSAGYGVQIVEVNGGVVTGSKITGNTFFSFPTVYAPGTSTGNTFSGNKVYP